MLLVRITSVRFCLYRRIVQRRRTLHRSRRHDQVERASDAVEKRDRVFDNYSGGSQKLAGHSVAVHHVAVKEPRPVFHVRSNGESRVYADGVPRQGPVDCNSSVSLNRVNRRRKAAKT